METDDGDRRADPVLRWYLASYGLSMLGTGLWLPLNAIFLVEQRGLSPAAVGAYYSVAAVVAILANLFVGTLADRLGPFRPLVVAGIAQATGIALLVVLDSRPGVFLAAVATGVGNGTFFAVQTAAVSEIFGIARLSTVFGRQYQIANIGIGAGGLVLGGLVHQLGYTGYVIGFSVNALSYAVHALNVAGPVRRMAIRAGLSGAGKRPPAPRPSLLRPYRDRRFLLVILIQLCVAMFGYAQLEAVVPVVFRDSAYLPVWAITAYTTANCISVVVFQPRSTNWVRRVGPERGLHATMVVWLIAAVAGLLAPHLGGLLRRLLAISAFAVVFAIGETLVSPSLKPLAATRAPSDRIASYTAAVSLTFSVGTVLAPPVFLPLFAAFGADVYWLVIAGGLVLGMGVVRLAQVSPEAQPDPVVGRGG